MAADTIRIDAGVKRILINDGPNFLEFNPTDVIFVEKFYRVMGEFEKRLAEYEKQGSQLDAAEIGEDGVPTNVKERIDFMHDICKFAFGQIDYLFGTGTSDHLFNGMESLDMIEQFFRGLTPIVQQARQQKVAKYRPSK